MMRFLGFYPNNRRGWFLTILLINPPAAYARRTSKRIKMSNNWDLHECGKLPRAGIRISYSMDNAYRKEMTWRLIISRKAAEDDLMENPVLEEPGETIWETSLEIAHCPFCGECLYDAQNMQPKDVG